VTAALGLALALAAVTPARADPRGGPGCGPDGEGERLERALDQFDLTPEARAAIDLRLDEARDARRSAHRELRSSFDTLDELMAGGSPDEAAIMAHVDAVSALRAQARKAQLRALLEVRQQLSDEQWADLQEDLRDGHHPRRRAHAPGPGF
jgi:Spy/CpxP family protein refolding chaperone